MIRGTAMELWYNYFIASKDCGSVQFRLKVSLYIAAEWNGSEFLYGKRTFFLQIYNKK